MAEFVKLGRASDVPAGAAKHVDLPDKTQICLANVGGVVHAIGGKCTHMGGPLGKGAFEGTVVTCPWHGSRFDVTSGAVLGPPATRDEPVYEVRIVGDGIEAAV